MQHVFFSRFFAGLFRLRNFILLFLSLSLFMAGCQKGDNGTPGADGPAGPAGPAGPQGVKGDSGTANVYYSDWFTPSPYTKDTVFNLYHFYFNQPAASITQKVIDSGSVLVYGKLDGYNTAIWPTAQVSVLPIIVQYKFSSTGITYSDTWSSFLTAGNLQIDFVDADNYYSSISTSHMFRYIVIPGGVKVTSAAKVEKQGSTETNTAGTGISTVRDWKRMSYQEVCEALNIPE